MKYVQVPSDDTAHSTTSLSDFERRLADETSAKIDVDYNAGTVSIQEQDNPLLEKEIADAIRAIRFGFAEEEAIQLVKESSYELETIDVARHTSNRRECNRQISRIIGENGRTRELFEELSGRPMRVYNNKVSFIGPPQDTQMLRRAAMMLIDGAPHRKVYNYLEQSTFSS